MLERNKDCSVPDGRCFPIIRRQHPSARAVTLCNTSTFVRVFLSGRWRSLCLPADKHKLALAFYFGLEEMNSYLTDYILALLMGHQPEAGHTNFIITVGGGCYALAKWAA